MDGGEGTVLFGQTLGFQLAFSAIRCPLLRWIATELVFGVPAVRAGIPQALHYSNHSFESMLTACLRLD